MSDLRETIRSQMSLRDVIADVMLVRCGDMCFEGSYSFRDESAEILRAMEAAGFVVLPAETDDRTRLATIMDLLTVEEVADIAITMPWFGLRLAQASMPPNDRYSLP